MPIACDPNAIAEASKCFCLPEKQFRGAVLYYLNTISGLNLTPKQLVENSKCFCMGEKASKAAELYLLCNNASNSGA